MTTLPNSKTKKDRKTRKKHSRALYKGFQFYLDEFFLMSVLRSLEVMKGQLYSESSYYLGNNDYLVKTSLRTQMNERLE